MTRKKLLIFPYSGTGIEAIDCLGQDFELIGFIDDNETKWGYDTNGYEIGSRRLLDKYTEAYILLVPGSPVSYYRRTEIIGGFNLPDKKFITIIHPGANVSSLAAIGFNTLIMGGVTITSDAVIGNHVCILPNSVVHHGVRIDDYTLVGSNVTLAGDVTLERNTYLGSSSSVIGGVTIGEKSLIGIGTNVIHSVPAKMKVVGNPGKIIGNVE